MLVVRPLTNRATEVYAQAKMNHVRQKMATDHTRRNLHQDPGEAPGDCEPLAVI
jgi:hypothetical protein